MRGPIRPFACCAERSARHSNREDPSTTGGRIAWSPDPRAFSRVGQQFVSRDRVRWCVHYGGRSAAWKVASRAGLGLRVHLYRRPSLPWSRALLPRRSAKSAAKAHEARARGRENVDVDEVLPDRHGVSAEIQRRHDGLPVGFAGTGSRLLTNGLGAQLGLVSTGSRHKRASRGRSIASRVPLIAVRASMARVTTPANFLQRRSSVSTVASGPQGRVEMPLNPRVRAVGRVRAGSSEGEGLWTCPDATAPRTRGGRALLKGGMTCS